MSRWPPPAGKSCAGPLPSLPTNYEPNFEIFHAIEPTPSLSVLSLSYPPSRRRRSTMSGVGASISVWQWQPIEEKRRRKAKVRPLFLPSVSLSEERGEDGASIVRGPHFRRPPPPPSLLLGWFQNLDVPFFPRPLFLLLFFHSLHEHVSLSLHVEFLPPFAVRPAQIRCVPLTATQSLA